MIVVGGERCWKQRVQKGWVIAYHWISLPEYPDHPCMILRPAHWQGRNPQGTSPFVIPMCHIGALVRRDGYPEPQLIDTAMQCLNSCNQFPDKFSVRNIVDVILDSVEDLKNMPPMERAGFDQDLGKIIGEMTLKHGDKQIAAAHMRDDTEEQKLEIKSAH